MRNLPAWEWPEMLILQAIFAAACAVLTSMVARNLLGMFIGVLLGPITQLLIVGILAGFFFYVFMFYFHREVPFRQVYLHVMFAAIPTMLCNIASPVAPPATVIGIFGTAMLLFVGFTNNFHLDRVKVRNILGGLVAVYIVCWAINMIGSSAHRERMHEKATPESLDILEKEMNKDE